MLEIERISEDPYFKLSPGEHATGPRISAYFCIQLSFVETPILYIRPRVSLSPLEINYAPQPVKVSHS